MLASIGQSICGGDRLLESLVCSCDVDKKIKESESEL